ncbi:MAG: hypothetical protein LBI85_04965, partial [Spirochaetaceae bacterium]|nr:hypothetical protein [Spirochaetaceae bacterium]
MKKTILCALFFCQLASGYTQVVSGSDITATASSELRDSRSLYAAQNLVDGSFQSWAEGVRGNGTGASFTLTVRWPLWIAGFALKNGYGDLNYFQMNNRVKSFKIYIDDEYIETIAVKDSIHFEQYALQTPVEGKKIRFVIDSVYPGTAYDDTCVAEIALLTEILGDENFYHVILPMVSLYEQQRTNPRGTMESVSDPDKIRLLD